MAEVVPSQAVAPPRRKPHWFRRLLVLLLFVVLGVSLLVNLSFLAGGATSSDRRVREEFHSLNKYGRYKVAIISVEGTILDGEGFVKRQIDRALKDEDLGALVLRVNSPGGTVTGADYLYHHLNKLRKERNIPLVVSMGGIAASGGYYVSMAVGSEHPDTIFAEPTTWTGSIGVIIPHYNATELLSEIGVEEDSVVSHPLKGMGSFSRTMTDEEREIFQVLVDDSFKRFKKIIRSGRPRFEKDPKALDELATGQVYTADQAVENGLVDRIGFIEEAIDRAITLARLPREEVRVVEYKREPTLADFLIGVRAQGASSFDLAALLDMTVPRAYYFCTRLPPLVRSTGQ
jgi:protease-4